MSSEAMLKIIAAKATRALAALTEANRILTSHEDFFVPRAQKALDDVSRELQEIIDACKK